MENYDIEGFTGEDIIFLDNPDIKITFGMNNKKSYFSLDKVAEYIKHIRNSESAEK